MATAEQFVAEAASEVGYQEQKTNRTKFALEADHINGYPWCGTFVVAIARRCGIKLPSESAYTPAMAVSFQRAKRWTQIPHVGDLAFFDFPDSKRRVQHVGIVERVSPEGVTCIEGNTSPGSGGSQDNGGGVYRRLRPLKYVVGFGRPEFTQGDELTSEQDEMLKRINHFVVVEFPRIVEDLRERIGRVEMRAAAIQNEVAD